MVGEILPGAILEYSVILPGQLILYPGGVGLLPDALGDGLLFRVADFCPTLVIDYPRSVVGVNHRHDMGKGVPFRKVE